VDVRFFSGVWEKNNPKLEKKEREMKDGIRIAGRGVKKLIREKKPFRGPQGEQPVIVRLEGKGEDERIVTRGRGGVRS